jgi:hypothetical protein
VTTHYSEDDLTLYYYGEGRRRDAIERHVEECPACKALYREIAGTLAMIAAPEAPERGDQYGLEVWQRIRHQLPEQESGFSGFSRFSRFWGFSGFGLAAAVALLLIAAFVGGRAWQRASTPGSATAANRENSANHENLANPANHENPANPANHENPENRILLTSVADHLDRSARILSDIMNASGRGDISIEQGWARDLLDGSRLYRQDAVDAGEQSVASVLDELERSLLEIVHSPSRISAADLERIRRRIDAAALLFKVRVMSDELRQREQPAARSFPRSSTTQKVS